MIKLQIRGPGIRMKDLYSYLQLTKQACSQKLARMQKEGEYILEVFKEVDDKRSFHKKMGAKGMHALIKPQEIGINKFQRLWAQMGYNQVLKRKKWITTNSNHPHKKRSNLVNGLLVNGVDQLWVADITYYFSASDLYYIFLLTDAYSQRIIGHQVSENLRAENAVKALKMAVKLRGKAKIPSLIHHSDKGSQYCCQEYIKVLDSIECHQVSMAKNCIENPYAERINGILKNNYLNLERVSTLKELKIETSRCVKLYNEEKPHGSLKMLTPVAFEEKVKLLKDEERPQLKLYDFINRKVGFFRH